MVTKNGILTRFAVLARFQWFPPSQVQVGDGGHTERIDGVAPLVDAMMKNRSEMLVTCIVEGKCLAERVYRLVASSLRPTVGIEVGVKSAANPSVDVGTSAKDSLG